MDRKLPENPEIRRLIQLSEQSRACLETDIAGLKRKLDVPGRLKSSLKTNPLGWLAGSMASGLVASMLLRRKPMVEKKRKGIPATLLGLTLTAARPIAKVWFAKQVKQWATGAISGPSSNFFRKPTSTHLNPP